VSVDELHEFVKHRLKADGHEGVPQKWVWNVPERIYITAVPRHVFVSYAHEDMAAVDRIAQGLEAEGLSVWIDREGIRSGNWKDRVTTGLGRARALVLLLTPSSAISDAVRKEIRFAAKKNVPIIPVLPHGMPDSDIPDWFILDYDELHRYMLDDTDADACIREVATAIRDLRRDASKRKAGSPRREVATR
jgi:1-acyl-sn-glycerol-3-phosphate acyltransferase